MRFVFMSLVFTHREIYQIDDLCWKCLFCDFDLIDKNVEFSTELAYLVPQPSFQ